MAPLFVEFRSGQSWRLLATLKPEDQSGSLSDNLPDGSRNVYHFTCLQDDSGSVITLSRGGVDTKVGPLRVTESAGFETVAELSRGNDPFILEVKTDTSSERLILRFTHK